MHITFVQDLIDIIRGKKRRAKNKIIEIFKNNNIDIPKEYKDKINLNIEGQNNTIIVPKNNHIIGNISINIYGDNNKIIFNENVYVANSLSISIGQNHPNFGKVINSSFTIGKNSGVESLSYITFNSNTYCNIEKDCMLSYGITIYNTDAHPIFKKDTKEVINKVKGITIGEHSWIGMNVTILKNSIIPSNSIVGCNSVFSGGGQCQSYCAFAGNPARVIKENVDWNSNGAKYGYIDNKGNYEQ